MKGRWIQLSPNKSGPKIWNNVIVSSSSSSPPTLSFVLKKQISLPHAVIYIFTQLTAGIAGVLCAHFMFDLTLLQTSENIRTGEGQWLAEMVATFGLVMTILEAVDAAESPHELERTGVTRTEDLELFGFKLEADRFRLAEHAEPPLLPLPRRRRRRHRSPARC